MNLWQAFKMAYRSIWGNKGRSALTMLGIIIGVASVMTIVTIMQGQNKQMMDMFKAMGTNQIQVSASLYNGQNIFSELYDYCLQMDDLVEGVTPRGTLWDLNVVYGLKSSRDMQEQGGGMGRSSTQFILGSHQYALCNNYQLAGGRDLTKLDVDDYSNVCVLGAQAAQDFFDLDNPVGKVISVNGIPFTVVGVYAMKDETGYTGGWLDNIMVFPYTAARTFGQDMSFMSEFVVKAKDSEARIKATALITGFLTNLIGDPNDYQNAKGWFNVYSNDNYMEQNNEAMLMMSLVLGGIAGISLLVGGIGIMNIMLVTVTERTREIGIRRAIGARRKSIVTQFLIESGMICGVGGVIGVGLGTVLSIIGSQALLKFRVLPSPGLTLGAVAFAVVLGLVFGMYPAVKASGLQPVEALRSE